MFADHAQSGKLLHRPRFLLLLFAAVFAAFFVVDFSQSRIAYLFAPVIGAPPAVGLHARFVVNLTLALLLCANIFGLSFLRFRVQVLVVWVELLVLSLGFFYLFDLSLAFMQRKIGFMVTQGVVTTLYLSAVSIAIASVIALIGAVAKLSSNGFAYSIATFYISIFRGLPLLVQVYLIYLGLPQLGFVIDAVPAGIVALSLCYGAYMAEIFRAGILGIPRGQWEGARALGFKFGLTMRLIILPQSIPLIIPPTGNQFIAMLKDSSLVSVLGVWEIMFLARTQGQAEFRHMEMLVMAALIYWLLSIILEAIQARVENHFRRASN
ncbi:MAG: amino acid ABC transporter permease [Gammaproteobacteria bacterium]|nr:amino acid ABC transporter permease [Gammaproteobacteria bacterium]